MLSPNESSTENPEGKLGGKAPREARSLFGQYGLQALAPGRITAQQIEAARVAMTRHIKRGGRSGSGSSPTNPSRKSPPKPAWGRARRPGRLDRHCETRHRECMKWKA